MVEYEALIAGLGLQKLWKHTHYKCTTTLSWLWDSVREHMKSGVQLSQGREPMQHRLVTVKVFILPHMWGVVLWEGFFFGFNHKIIINVQESPPSIMVTRNLWSARVWIRDWLCKGKMHHPQCTPQCTLPKVSYIVIWSLFMRESLPYWVKS